MAGAGNRSGGLRRRSGGGLSKATGRGREARAAYKSGRGQMRATAKG
jgi:hypothetical protein